MNQRHRMVTTEVLAFTASLLLYPFGLKKSHKRTPRKAEQRTIVFIHGYLANRSAFLPLAGYLATKGWRSNLHFEYGPSESVEQTAIRLKKFLQQNVRGGRIDLICHSLGGLVARVYLQQLGGARRVDRCITIATPHQGTYNAYWFWSRVAQDLRPESTLLKRLAATEDRAAQVKFLAIGGGADLIIIPPRSAEFAAVNAHFPETGHQGLLFSPGVFRQISAHLAS